MKYFVKAHELVNGDTIIWQGVPIGEPPITREGRVIGVTASRLPNNLSISLRQTTDECKYRIGRGYDELIELTERCAFRRLNLDRDKVSSLEQQPAVSDALNAFDD